jgi:glycosyltransferase involved in cell wall biosynthesis
MRTAAPQASSSGQRARSILQTLGNKAKANDRIAAVPPSAANVATRQPQVRLAALSCFPGGFSGLPDAVLNELQARCKVVRVIDGLYVPRPRRLWIAARTIRPRRTDWGRQYYAELGNYYKRPDTLLYRMSYCERELTRLRGSYDLIYQFGALFGALNRPTHAPLILHIDFTTRLAEEYYHGWLPASTAATEEWNRIETEIYHSADLIFVPTRLVAASLSEHCGVHSDKVAVVGMGAHIEDLTEDFSKPRNRNLVFAGPDFGRHGGELALQIFESVRSHLPDATLTTVTNRSVGVPGARNLGVVPRPRLHEILREAAVLLTPGPVGGYQTVTEAMAAKCLCVVAESNPHMNGLIRNGENGLTVAPAHASRAVQSLVGYLEHPESLAAIGGRAREHVIQECSWPRIVGRIWEEIKRRFPDLFPNGSSSRHARLA